MKKEIKDSKPKNPFLYIIQISKKHKKNNSIIANIDKSKFFRTNTPIKFVKKQNKNVNNRLNISSNQMLSCFDSSKILYKNISNHSPLNSFPKVRYKSQNKQSYESIKLEMNKLKNQLNKQNKEIEKSQNKINNLLNENLNLKNQIKKYKEKIEELKKKENLNKENLLYNYFVEMNEQIMHSLNEDMPNLDNMTYEELLALEEKMGNVKKGFSEKEKYNLPVVVYSKKWFKNQDNCVICLNDFQEKEKVMKLGCDHIFHVDCMKDWLENNKKCPLCKKDIKICFTVNDMYK